MKCSGVRLRQGHRHCASQKNVLQGMRWAAKHGNRVTHKELRAAGTFLFPLSWYSPSPADATGKSTGLSIEAQRGCAHSVLLSCSTALPARVRTQFTG